MEKEYSWRFSLVFDRERLLCFPGVCFFSMGKFRKGMGNRLLSGKRIFEFHFYPRGLKYYLSPLFGYRCEIVGLGNHLCVFGSFFSEVHCFFV